MPAKGFSIEPGRVFSRLTIIGPTTRGSHGHLNFCRCSCGKKLERLTSDLLAGRVKSCGCGRWKIRRAAARALVSGPPFLQKIARHWIDIGDRVNNNGQSSKWYKGRGIGMWEGWQGDDGFRASPVTSPWSWGNLTSALLVREHGRITIDRLDNDRGYEPGNIRWASYQRQGRQATTTSLNAEARRCHSPPLLS